MEEFYKKFNIGFDKDGEPPVESLSFLLMECILHNSFSKSKLIQIDNELVGLRRLLKQEIDKFKNN